MKRPVLFLSVFCFLGFYSHAQIISTFNTDADGWTATHTGGTTATVNFQSSGGNPDGFISAAPPTAGGTVNTSFAWYWNAPAKFFGDFDFSYGSNFKVDLQQSVAGTDNTVSDIIIYSGGNSIHFNFPTKPAVSPAWTSYSIALDETAGWRWGSVGGALALKPQIKIILANITGIRIRCKYVNSTGYTSGMDNVVIEKRTLEVAPVITSFAPTSALPGSTVTINGSNFGAAAPNNIVYFGNVRAEVETANPSQLTVTVPNSATLAPISVINTTNSLVAVSASSFLPLVFSDPDFIGNLLPGSFANNVIVPYGDFNDNGLAGGAMGDMDGDGLLDIIAFEDPGEFAIFLNQGQTGPLTSTSFASKIQIPSGELGQGNSSGTIIHDFDNDGKIDIATFFRGANPALSGGFAVSRNVSTPGNISFEPAEQFYNVGIFCSGLDAADLDGDGLLDFLINSSGLYYARNISTPGNIEFASTRFLNASGGAVSTKDLNGDGKPEIMVVSSGSFNLLENTSTPGNIQFAAPVNFPGSVVSGITMADLDSDTKPDILYYRINGFNNYDLVVKKNIHSTGALTLASFDADVILSKVNRAYSQRVADLNGDGKPDILIGLNSGSTGYGFGVFENRTQPGTLTTSSFLPPVEYEETSNGVFAIPLIGDLNGDLLPDVVGFASSDGGEHGLILYTNQTIAAPNISVNTVSPLAAPVGSTVTITGNKFSTDITKNTVWFGAVKAQVLTATKNQLTVTVPPGASYERVSVTRDNRTSRYHLPFSTTFSSGVPFDGTSFGAPVTFPVTGADYDVEVADLNGDGKPELIAESRVVTGIIRNYAWSFENVHTTGAISTSSFIISDTTNESAFNLRMVDLDEDGRLDIVSQTAMFRNTTSTNEIEFDNNVSGVSGLNQNWADFDLDGKTDVITTDGGTNLLIFRNRSKPGPFRTGAFATFGSSIGLSKPSANGGTAVGDFDNDGLVDIAAANPATDNMRVWRNTGGFPLTAAQFVLVGDLATGDNPGRVYTGDFDRDGKLDIMLYHSTGTSNTLLSIFHNTSTLGNISFNRIDLTNPSATTVATVADLDGDGKPEIIATSESGNRFSIFKNIHTSGALTAASFAAPFNTTVTAPRGITTGDLNLDGKPEIILTRAAGLLVVYENLISSIQPPTITSFTPASGPVGTSVTITGTNFDTTPANNIVYFGATRATVTAATPTQLVVTVPMGATYQPISVAINSLTAQSRQVFITTFAGEPLSACSFAPKVDFPTGNFPTGVRLSDLNADGRPDIITTNKNSNTVSVLLANGSGGFNPKTDYATGTFPSYVAIGDLNGDGKPDLIVANDNSALPPNYVSVLLGNGDGTFTAKTDFLVGVSPQSLALGDLNLDGKLDVIVANSNETTVSVLLGLGTGSLAARVNYPVLVGTTDIAVLDANKDSRPDIVVVNYFNNSLSILLGDGLGGLGTRTDFTTGTGPANLAIADLNGDGNTDLITSNADANTLSVLFGNGTGGFSVKTDYATGVIPRQVAVSDLNGDGILDVSVVNESSNTVSVFQGAAAGTLNTKIDFPTASGPFGIAMGDINADGKPDLVLTNSISSTVSVLNNIVGTPAPTISSFTPSIGPTGTTVTITGTNFSTPFATSVSFNGTPAVISGTTATTLTVTVPAGATTGPIVVTIGCNTVTSGSNFTVGSPALPTITSFTPSSGLVATTVTITGTNFDPTPANNTVAFNSATAIATASTATSITTTVPTGATTGKITVTVNGNTATSATDFTVTTLANQPPVIQPAAAAVPINGIVTLDLLPLLSDPDDNLDLATLALVSSTSEQGASLTLSGTATLTLDYGGVAFAGTDRVEISICDLANACTQQNLEIDVGGDVTVYNAFSPDGNIQNPIFFIEYIELLPEARNNRVLIFNRWGDEVWAGNNYNNDTVVFAGKNNQGNELPSGTYFYKILFNATGKTQTGYLVLRR